LLSLAKCKLNNLDTKFEITKPVLRGTILKFIPQKSPRITYIETLKIDFDHLIYNCGGVLGLWFGMSLIKAVDL
jgi:hypothetical protein